MSAVSPLIRLVDFVDSIISGGRKQKDNTMVLISYVLMGGLVGFVWHHHSNQELSFVLTLSQMFQTFAFFVLLHKIRSQRSVAGISSKTLQIYVMVFIFRLSSTLVKNGYLPMDSTGEWVYQASDVASLLLVFQILFSMHRRHGNTYQSDLDTMPIMNIVPVVFVVGCCCHGSLNKSLFFDRTWSIGMWLDTVAMLPQLWMLVAKGGEVEALNANYVAAIFISKCWSFTFWYYGYPELAPADGSLNKVGIYIITAHSLQLLFSLDFMYHYFMWQANAMVAGCGATRRGMVLPVSGTFDI